MRWQCSDCLVEWSTPGEDHGPCFHCEKTGAVKKVLEVPEWMWGYRGRRDWNRVEAWSRRL